MLSHSLLAETAALVGDPARAGILLALMDGRALTAGELARAAGITPQAGRESRILKPTAVPLAVRRGEAAVKLQNPNFRATSPQCRPLYKGGTRPFGSLALAIPE
jgi:hypothetical protein